mmetsp:Transcript_19314/g.28596  ORF Transcript_19314/g.28596 Transcript_19314/m.28596 type:complete len:88 (+) Transcript_19314:2-265(+)
MLNGLLRLHGSASWYQAHGALSSRSVKNMDGLLDELCQRLAAKSEQVLDAFFVPPELVEKWPLNQEDYSSRLRDLAYPCGGENEFAY